jgi:hypothetical protein
MRLLIMYTTQQPKGFEKTLSMRLYLYSGAAVPSDASNS